METRRRLAFVSKRHTKMSQLNAKARQSKPTTTSSTDNNTPRNRIDSPPRDRSSVDRSRSPPTTCRIPDCHYDEKCEIFGTSASPKQVTDALSRYANVHLTPHGTEWTDKRRSPTPPRSSNNWYYCATAHHFANHPKIQNTYWTRNQSRMDPCDFCQAKSDIIRSRSNTCVTIGCIVNHHMNPDQHCQLDNDPYSVPRSARKSPERTPTMRSTMKSLSRDETLRSSRTSPRSSSTPPTKETHGRQARAAREQMYEGLNDLETISSGSSRPLTPLSSPPSPKLSNETKEQLNSIKADLQQEESEMTQGAAKLNKSVYAHMPKSYRIPTWSEFTKHPNLTIVRLLAAIEASHEGYHTIHRTTVPTMDLSHKDRMDNIKFLTKVIQHAKGKLAHYSIVKITNYMENSVFHFKETEEGEITDSDDEAPTPSTSTASKPAHGPEINPWKIILRDTTIKMGILSQDYKEAINSSPVLNYIRITDKIMQIEELVVKLMDVTRNDEVSKVDINIQLHQTKLFMVKIGAYTDTPNHMKKFFAGQTTTTELTPAERANIAPILNRHINNNMREMPRRHRQMAKLRQAYMINEHIKETTYPEVIIETVDDLQLALTTLAKLLLVYKHANFQQTNDQAAVNLQHQIIVKSDAILKGNYTDSAAVQEEINKLNSELKNLESKQKANKGPSGSPKEDTKSPPIVRAVIMGGPNLTPNEVQKKIQAIIKEMNSHGIEVEFEKSQRDPQLQQLIDQMKTAGYVEATKPMD